MSLATVALAVHVVVACVGVGLLGAIPIVAGSARRTELHASVKTALLGPLFRVTRWSLFLMFLSGALIDFGASGAFHTAWWFRGSVLLLVFVGLSHARARAALRKLATPSLGDEDALRRIEAWSWAALAAVALIAFLMATKPF